MFSRRSAESVADVVPPRKTGVACHLLVSDNACLLLAAFQTADLMVTQLSQRYGDSHLDHLGVPAWLRPALPSIKLLVVVTLMASVNRPRVRSVVGAGLVGYYSAATAFHVLSHDTVVDMLPAATCSLLAAKIV